MATVHRVSRTAVVIVCLVSTQWNGVLFASEAGGSSSTAAVSPLLTTVAADVQAPTSLGLGHAVAIGEQLVETTGVSSASRLRNGGARLPFGAFAVNEAIGTVASRGKSHLEIAPDELDRNEGQDYQGDPY